MGRRDQVPGEEPVGDAPTFLAGLHSSPSAFLNTNATKQVSALSFSEKGEVAISPAVSA